MHKLAKFSVLGLWCCAIVGSWFGSAALAQSTDAAKQRQEESRQSRDKLRSIGLALAKNLPKEFAKKAYPAGYSDQEGKLILSWRVAILSALGEEELFKQFRLDQPWDSEHNRKLIPKMPDVFKPVRGESKEGHTYYRGFAGEDAMFPLKSPTAEKVPAGDRSYFPVFCRPLSKLLDGTSNTFLIAEGAETVPWTKPEELVCDAKLPLPKLGGQFETDFNVLQCDGAPRQFPTKIPEQALRAYITPSGGETNIELSADGLTVKIVTPEMEAQRVALFNQAEKSPHASLAQITDATNETAFAGIVAEGRAVPWTKPDDLVFDDTFQTKDNAFVGEAFLFANGSARYLHLQEGLDRAQFRALFTIAGKEPSPLTSLYPPGHKLVQPTYATPQEQVRQAIARRQNVMSLKEIALAFHNYEQVFKHLPPATIYGPDGKPWHSWRVLILPFLEYSGNALYQQYDGTVPWDHPKNAAVLATMPLVYRDPLSDKPSNKTRYLLATGAGTAFPTKPTGNVVAQAPTQPNPAPPKPVAKDGREPIQYQPFRPDVWKAKNQSTWLFPWEGERIVLLTTTADLDPKTMAVFVKQLDAAWKLCSDLVGQSPRPFRVHNGKVTIAAVPDSSFSGGGLVPYLGMTGMEVGGFYVPRGDYDQVRQNPEKFPEGFFFGIGQNHFVFANQCGVLSTGGIVALRHICAEAINGSDKDPQADQTIYRYEEAFAKSNATFQEAFAPFGATKPFVLNDLDGKPFGNIDLNVFIASTFLKLRKDNGGNEWTKRFFRHLGTCPPTAGSEINGAKAQLLNWVVAASLAAEKDLSAMLRDRWRFPLAPEVWQSLKTVDWKKPGLTADNVFDALPIDQLLPSVAMARPGFLTPERRKQNLLVGGTFEDGSGGMWTVGSFRGNAAAATVEGGVAKEGQKAVVIRAPINDDARYLQKVAVKPNTRYLVSGWIKTKDVVVVEPTGRTGANLSIDAHTYEMSQSVVGTNDWRYASFLFDSGTRTDVLVCARIGFVYSTAKGEAWFDDLCLIPIGDSPVRPTAPVPAATITTNKDWKGWSKDTPPPAIAPFNAEQAKQHQEAWAKHLGVPVEYTNSIGMKFRLIPPGEYLRGCSPEEIAADVKAIDAYWGQFVPSSGPQHKVILTQPFYLGVYEVTQEAYSRVMGHNPSHYAPTGPGRAFVGGRETGKFPVERVSWNDAVDFCAKLSAKEKLQPCYTRAGEVVTLRTGNGYRLPTEAEWELACRAGTTTTFWNGNSVDEYAQVGRNYANKSEARTHPVGELKSNPFGLFDIHGNVWEYAQDNWSSATYRHLLASGNAVDPLCLPFGNGLRAIRGGSCMDVPTTSTSGSRLALGPTSRDVKNAGFRATLSVEAVKVALANPVQAEAPLVENNAKQPLTLKGHTAFVHSVAFSPDGKRLATASVDQTVKVRDSTSGQELLTLKGHTGEVTSVVFRPDGKWLASSSHDQTVKVWDAASGLESLTLKGHTGVITSVAYSPDGKRLASASYDQTVKVWDSLTGRPILTLKGHTLAVMGVAFSPDGKRLASAGSDRVLKVWDATSGKATLTLPGHGGSVTSVAFSPDGKWLASSSGDNTVKVWDATTGRETLTFKGHAGGVTSVAFSPDGKRLASAAGGREPTLKLWDVTSGQEFRTLIGHTDVVRSVAFSADGKWLASASGHVQNSGEVMVWDIAPQAGVAAKGPSAQPSAIARQKEAEGDKHREQKEYAQAVACYREVIQHEPNNAAMLNRLAWVLAVAPQKDQPAGEALKFAQRVIQQQPSNPLYRNSLGAGQFRAGLYAEALSNLVAVGNAPPKDFAWLAHNLLYQTLCHAKQGDHASAQIAYDKALVLLKPAEADMNHRWHEARLLQQEVVASGVFERVPELLTLRGHSDLILSVAYSPDGKLIASGSRDQSVKLWDAATGQEVRSLKGNLGYVTGLAFSPDSKTVATPSILELKNGIPGDVKLWDVATGKEKGLMKGHADQVWCVAYSPDGKRLVSCSLDGTLYLWDAASGQAQQTLKTGTSYFTHVVFSPDGKQLATSGSAISGGDKAAKVWDIASGKPLLRLSGHADTIGSVAFSPDGKRIVTGSTDKTLKVWDATTGKELLTLTGHEGQIPAVAYSPDGKWIASGCTDQTMKLWDAVSGVETRTMRGHAAGVSGVAFSPDGKRLVSSSGDQTLKVWDVANIRSISVRPGSNQSIAKPAAKPVAISGAPVMLTLQPENRGFTSVAFSTDGRLLATASIDQPVNVWDAVSGQETLTLKGGWCATFSSDGKRLASGGPDKMVRVFDTTNGQETLALQGHTNSVLSVAFSPDGMRLASASGDQTVKVWDATTGTESLTLKGHTGDVRSVAFSPDGKRLASSSRDQTVKLWDATSGSETLTLKGHTAEIRSVAFSPDGKWLASASHDQTVKLWDSTSGHLVRTLEGHDSGVMSFAFSSDGARLASASCDQSVKVWDSASGQVLLTLKGHNSQVVGVALSADGKRLASASYDQTVKVWDITPGTKPVGDVAMARATVSRTVPPAEMKFITEASTKSRPLTNGDFTAGRDGWQIEGGANEFRTFAQGTATALTTAGINKDPLTGRLYQCFKVPDDAIELQFSLHGGADSETTYVALWHFSQLQRRISARNDNTPFRVNWNVMSLRGQVVTLEIVDNSAFSWGFIGAQGFELIRQKETDQKHPQQVFDTDQEPLTLKGHTHAVTSVEFSADGKRLISISRDSILKVWDATSGQETLSTKTSTASMALRPDGNWMATAEYDGTVKIDDLFGAQETVVLKGHSKFVVRLAFSRDGKRLASASEDGTLKVWDATSGRETLSVRAHATPIRSLSFSSDGKRLATVSYNEQTVKVWDATTGQELLSLKPFGGVFSNVVFSSDGQRLASIGGSRMVSVWDAASGRELLTLKDDRSFANSVVFSPDGKWLATASDNDQSVRLWDAMTGRQAAAFNGHSSDIASVAFTRDGKRLASASGDATVKVWDVVPRSAADKKAEDATKPIKVKPPAAPVIAAGKEQISWKGHARNIHSLVFSPDGKRLVSAGEDKAVKVWDATKGQELLTLNGHSAGVRSVAINSDGSRIASAGRDQLLKVWDATNGRELLSIKADVQYLTGVAFSPDGKRLATAGVNGTKVWDATTGKEVEVIPVKRNTITNTDCVAFSPDGKLLASDNHDGTVTLRDATNGQEKLTLKGHIGGVISMAFSPDAKRLATGSKDQTIKLWDVASGRELLTRTGHQFTNGVTFSPDGTRLAAAGSLSVKVWDAATLQETLTLEGYGTFHSIAFSPDGKRLVAADDDGRLRVWDLTLSPNDDKKSAANRPMPPKEEDRPVTMSVETALVTQAIQDDPLTITLKGHTEATTSLAVSPDGKWLASASSDGVVVWDVPDRKARYTLRSHGRYAISSVAISPDGKRLAAGVEKVVKVWDAATGAELQSLAGNTDRVNGIAFSSDGQRIASATQDQTVTIWDITSGKVIDTLKEKLQSFGAIAFSPDGKWMAVGTLSGDTTGKVWKAASHEESFGLHGHDFYIKCLAFSADGKRLVSASDDGSVKIWDTLTGDNLLTLRDRRLAKSPAESRAHQSNQMKSVAVSPDGQRLVTAGSNGFVSVWDAGTGQKLLSLEGHQGEVRGVAFSPDGKWAASAGADAMVKVWTLADRPTLPPDGTVLKTNVDPKKAEADLKAFEGTWQVTDYATNANQPLPPEVAASIKEQRVVFQGDVLTFASRGRSESMVVTVDPTQPLKAIDLSSFDQGDSSPSMLGVYSLAGDTLKLAMSPIEAGRPKELKPGDGVLTVMTLTRTKSSDVQPTDSFNFHTWRQASKNLQRMNVKAKLANRESLRLAQLDRGFGLPETISRWGVIGLPTMTDDAGIPDAMWKEITAISHIVMLTPSVNDALLKQLSQHRGLIALHVTGAWSATASSTAELKNCPHMINIGLEGSPETVETVRKLTALSNLRDLTILNATATQELVTAITKFKELESLNLPDAGVTDDQAAQISTLKNLKFLVLQQARVADKDKLKLSDKGLRSLTSLKDLRWLDLQGHAFSAEAAADFKVSLPNCQVLMNVTNPKTNIEF